MPPQLLFLVPRCNAQNPWWVLLGNSCRLWAFLSSSAAEVDEMLHEDMRKACSLSPVSRHLLPHVSPGPLLSSRYLTWVAPLVRNIGRVHVPLTHCGPLLPRFSFVDGVFIVVNSDQQLDCALDLMRRLPPQQIEKNLSDLIDLNSEHARNLLSLQPGTLLGYEIPPDRGRGNYLPNVRQLLILQLGGHVQLSGPSAGNLDPVPSLCEDLLSSVDQPLKIARDKVVGKDYLLCDYNRDGDSYRSPWSNKYDPPLEDGAMPSARLRKLEVEANNAFDQYRDLYFEGGVSSVYLWDLDHGFAGVILIKKAGDGSKKIKGCWDSIHVVEVQEKSSGRTAHYKLTSTVMLWLQTNKSGSGTMNLGGSLTRQMEKDETVSDCSPHIANIGRLVEDMENKIRSTLNEIYFGKTKDIVNGLRSVDVIPDNPKFQQLQRELSQVLTQRQIHIQPDN
ncbi:F-actin-capping protein subunit beta isoform a [Camelus ferus]|nr:F-actin-capping protein subunit beta isoform a [Camelus ferus]